MKLPNLSELDFDDELEHSREKEPAREKKVENRSGKDKIRDSRDDEEVIEENKGKPKIPKTQYDNEGNPILSIPDLDDVNLAEELGRFFD